jgi:hypothetical protein
MRNAKIFTLVALALVSFACKKETGPEDKPVVPDNPNAIVFTAGAPGKTVIDANDEVVTWVAGDEVKFVWEGGSTTAAASTSGASTTFSVEVGEGITELYAVYPASAGGSYDNGNVNVHFNGTRTDGSFAANDFAVAKAVKTGDTWSTTLAFKNVACLIKVGVTGSDITKIQVMGGRSPEEAQAISGYLPVSINNSGEPVFDAATSTSGTVNMTVSGPGNYYIPILPGVELPNGLRIGCFKGDDQITPFFYKPSTATFTTARAQIIRIPDIDAKAGQYYVTPSGAGAKSGQSWTHAMDPATFKAFIEDSNNHFLLNGSTIHFSAESFSFGDYLQPDFSGHGEVAFTIEGTTSGSDITTFVGSTGDAAGTLWPKSNCNLTVKNVKFTGTDGNSNRAAIRVNNSGAKLNLEDCVFDNNKTSGQSGAVNLIKGTITITDCEFTNNSSSSGGASLHVEEATVTVSGCTFANNSGDGNALHITNTNGVVTMEDCDISGGNKCTIYGVNANTVSFTRVNFHDNHADDDSGAAAWLEGAGTYTFTDCDFVNNAADWRGGAIGINSSDVNVSFTGGKFQGNHADGVGSNYAGGAICVAKGSVDCTNVLFKENYSFVGNDTNAGGIIRLTTSGDCARFDHCVFDNNWSCRSSQSNNSCAAIINCRNGGTKFYFNACEFKNNSSGRGYSSGNEQGGKSGQVMTVWASATIGMNNCSMHDNFASRSVDDGSIYWICMGNAGSKLILSNSSIIGDQVRRPESTDQLKSKNGVIRLDADCTVRFINSIICSNYSDGKSVGCKAAYDVPAYYCKVSPGLDSDTHWTNTTGFGADYWADSSCFGGWSAPWTWNGTLTGTNSNMLAATADVNTEIQSADADFYAWLNSIGALGKDINGNNRGATSWPGCYQN